MLDKELDKTKASVFIGNNSAFLGSIMCSQNFSWSETIPTACTDMINLKINPTWFMGLNPKTRSTVLLHELWHVARLHGIRRGERDPKIWNYACDIRINNDLFREGHCFIGVEDCWLEPELDHNEILSEEEIYEILLKREPEEEEKEWNCDIEYTTDKLKVLSNVTQAIQQAKLAKQFGNLPGTIEEIVKAMLNPKIPWQVLLYNYIDALGETEYSWRRPNKRYSDIYLPSLVPTESSLEHILYFIDVSGSISSIDIAKCTAEIIAIWQQIQPQKFSIIQFDTEIHSVIELEDEFTELNIIGRGGTCLKCVEEHINTNNPTISIIFSDLDCLPMEPVSTPVIWLTTGNIVPTFGKTIKL